MTANFANPDFFSKRVGETQIAYEMRVGPYLHHREDAQADARQAHAEFRQQQEARTQGTGYGLAGDMSREQRATAVGGRGFGERRVEANGHLAWEGSQSGVRRVYASQLREQPGVSPLTAHLRSTGEGWH